MVPAGNPRPGPVSDRCAGPQVPSETVSLAITPLLCKEKRTLNGVRFATPAVKQSRGETVFAKLTRARFAKTSEDRPRAQLGLTLAKSTGITFATTFFVDQRGLTTVRAEITNQ